MLAHGDVEPTYLESQRTWRANVPGTQCPSRHSRSPPKRWSPKCPRMQAAACLRAVAWGGGMGGMDFQVNRSAPKRKEGVRLGRLVKNRRHDLILPAMPKYQLMPPTK